MLAAFASASTAATTPAATTSAITRRFARDTVRLNPRDGLSFIVLFVIIFVVEFSALRSSTLRRDADLRRIEALLLATTSTASAPATTAAFLLAAFTLAMLGFADDDRVRLVFALRLGNERLVARFLFLSDRRNADRRPRLLSGGCLFGKFAQLRSLFGG